MTLHAIVIAFGLTAAAGAASAPPTAAMEARVVAGLQAWLDGTETLDVHFRQSLVSGALGTTATESGRMYLERPGKLRWDYAEPERKVALLLGNRTELYLEEERQLTRGRLSAENGLFPRLLAGDGRVEASFQMTLLPDPPDGGVGGYRLRLVPRSGGGALTEVILTLRSATFAIERAEVLDEMGNRTRYTFTGSKRNGRLPEGIFAFEPPPGTEVVDEP